MRVFVPLALMTVLFSCSHEKPALQKVTTPVRVSTVENYTPAEGQHYSASILPARQVNLSFRVNGIVEQLHQVRGADGHMRPVDLGDMVKPGTVLAQVRPTDYQLQVSQAGGQLQQATQTEQTARAQLQQAQAAAIKAEQDFARADSLYKKTSLTKSDWDAAKANRDGTEAQVAAAQSQVQASAGTLKSARAMLGTADLSLHDASLRVPFTSAVVQRSVDIGTMAGPSVVAFVLADVSSVKATFAVSDIVIAHLKSGSKLTVYLEAFPNKRFQGFVSALAPAADSTTRSFQVEVTIPNPQLTLKPGMIASLDLGSAAGRQPVMVVPLSAIVRDSGEGSSFAVLIVENDHVRRVPVQLGETYGDRLKVNGLKPGQKVVSSGATFLNDGDAVRVMP